MSVPPFDIIDQRCTHHRCPDKANQTTYRMRGACSNCGAGPLVGLFTTGHETHAEGKCPACGCYSVRWDKLADLDPETAL